MTTRHTLVPANMWPWLGPALKGLDADLANIESNGVPASGNITASQVTSGVLATARLGTGTASASTFLAGDGTWKTPPSGSTGSVSWTNVTDKPTLATVATSGAYNDLTGLPDIPDVTTLAPKANPTFTGTVTFTSATVAGLGVDAAVIKTGTIPPTRLGAGTRDATTVLHGDSNYRVPTVAAANVTGVLGPAKLGAGATGVGDKFLADDGTWKTPAAGVGTDITIRQNTDGTWPTITRVSGAHYRWFAAYDEAKLPAYASGARTGDELVTPAGTTVIA